MFCYWCKYCATQQLTLRSHSFEENFCRKLCYLLQVSAFILCPYCDPNYEPYQNVDEACRGYDVYMGNPVPAQGRSDPGIRNQVAL